jgi:hypothetical protein
MIRVIQGHLACEVPRSRTQAKPAYQGRAATSLLPMCRLSRNPRADVEQFIATTAQALKIA